MKRLHLRSYILCIKHVAVFLCRVPQLSLFGHVVSFDLKQTFGWQNLVACFWVFGHVSFEMRGMGTWVNALWALVWLFSSVNAEVLSQISCLVEWAPALFTGMWLLSTVGDQMFVQIWIRYCGVVAPFALIGLLSSVNAEVLFQISC